MLSENLCDKGKGGTDRFELASCFFKETPNVDEQTASSIDSDDEGGRNFTAGIQPPTMKKSMIKRLDRVSLMSFVLQHPSGV